MRPFVRVRALAIVMTLAVSAHAADDDVRARLHPEPNVWPGVFGAVGLVAGATSFWFFFQTGRYADRAERIREEPARLAFGESTAPCRAGGDAEYCALSEKMDVAVTIGCTSLAISGAFLALSAISYFTDPSPRKSAKSIAPVLRF